MFTLLLSIASVLPCLECNAFSRNCKTYFLTISWLNRQASRSIVGEIKVPLSLNGIGVLNYPKKFSGTIPKNFGFTPTLPQTICYIREVPKEAQDINALTANR